MSGVKPDLREIRPDRTKSNLIKPRRARETGELREKTGARRGQASVGRKARPTGDRTESNLFGVDHGTGFLTTDGHEWTRIVGRRIEAWGIELV